MRAVYLAKYFKVGIFVSAQNEHKNFVSVSYNF